MTHRPPRQIESQQQQALITWLGYEQKKYPELAYLYAIPNGGLRSARTAGRLKAEGVKAGVSDLCLPVPRDKHHGLYLEMKAPGNTLTPAQKDFLEFVGRVGYATAVCYSAQEARDKILRYLELPAFQPIT